MSMTVRLTIGDWPPREGPMAIRDRPQFTNPVPAAVTSGDRRVGELDAHLHWEGEVLLARIPLPALPGHALRAHCTIDARVDDDGTIEQWIDGISVTIEHVGEKPSGELQTDMRPVPVPRARAIDDVKKRASDESNSRRPDQRED